MPRSLRIRVAESERGVTTTRRVIALVVASLCLAAAPRAAVEAGRIAQIGFLANEATLESGPVLRQALHDRGWVEGRNVRTSHRYAQGKLGLFPGHVPATRLPADLSPEPTSMRNSRRFARLAISL